MQSLRCEEGARVRGSRCKARPHTDSARASARCATRDRVARMPPRLARRKTRGNRLEQIATTGAGWLHARVGFGEPSVVQQQRDRAAHVALAAFSGARWTASRRGRRPFDGLVCPRTRRRREQRTIVRTAWAFGEATLSDRKGFLVPSIAFVRREQQVFDHRMIVELATSGLCNLYGFAMPPVLLAPRDELGVLEQLARGPFQEVE